MLFVGSETVFEALPVADIVTELDLRWDVELDLDLLSESDCNEVPVDDLLDVDVRVADNSDDVDCFVLE